jgi:hypothetical protein
MSQNGGCSASLCGRLTVLISLRQGQESCLRLARLGPAMVEICVEDVTDPRGLRSRPVRAQSNQARFVGTATGEQGGCLSQDLAP